MTAWLRRAGWGILPDGEIRWSVAEGARGRRWRWTLSEGGRLETVALLELATDGRFVRLELESAHALVTFHPDAGDRQAHGNVVRDGGVTPIAVPWAPGWTVAFARDAFGTAVAGWRGDGLKIDRDGTWEGPGRGLAAGTWRVDERGVPRLGEHEEWPLEAGG